LKQIGKTTMFEKCLFWKLVAVIFVCTENISVLKKRIRKKIRADTRTVTSSPQKEKGTEAVRLGEKQWPEKCLTQASNASASML